MPHSLTLLRKYTIGLRRLLVSIHRESDHPIDKQAARDLRPQMRTACARSIVLILMIVSLLGGVIGTHASGQNVPDPRDAAQALLNQAKKEKDPARRIVILEEALKNQSLRGWLLSSLLIERAMALKQTKDYYRAIEDFSSALAQSSRAFPWLLDKAECLIMVDQLEEAARDIEYYLLTKPGTAQAYVLKGLIYEKEGFVRKAEDEYTRALHYEPQSPLAREMRAKVVLKAGKPKKALDDLNPLIEQLRDRPDLYLMRAGINLKLKDYQAALDDFARLATLLPGDDGVPKEKVLVYFKMNQPEKALETLALFPAPRARDADVQVLRARAYILLRNLDQADRIIAGVLAHADKYAPAYLYRGVILVRRNSPDAALTNLNRSIELDPSLVEAYKERARLFINLGEPVRAAVDLTAATNLDPSDGEIFFMRALTQFQRMLYEAAIVDLTRALEALPGDPRIHYDRAVAFLLSDQYDAALTDLEVVLKARPDSSRALCMRAVAWYHIGKTEEARQEFQRAVAQAPKDPLIWGNWGFFLYKTGDPDGAVAALTKALELDPEYAAARRNLDLVTKKQEIVNHRTTDGDSAESSGSAPPQKIDRPQQ